jgi:surface polysaccharide O-acyltransferase-like enzyme
MNTKVNAIDFFKLFFAIGIVGIHSGVIRLLPSPTDYYVLRLWFRVGVPYFFIASGYFFGKKLSEKDAVINMNHLYSFCIRLLVPLFVWGGLKLFKTLITDFRHDDWQYKIISDIHRSIFYPPAGMWFVLSTIVAAIIIVLLFRHEILMVILSLIAYLFALFCNSYYFLIKGSFLQGLFDAYLEYFISPRNGIFVGLLFFGAGVFISRRENKGLVIKKSIAYLLFVISIIAYIIEIVSLRGKTYADDGALFIFSVFLSGSLFIVTKNMNMPYTVETSLIMRDLSKYIFFLHSFVMSYLSYVLLHFTDNEFFFTVHTLILCILIYVISKKLNLKFMKTIIP